MSESKCPKCGATNLGITSKSFNIQSSVNTETNIEVMLLQCKDCASVISALEINNFMELEKKLSLRIITLEQKIKSITG
jgi:hypothetical protein